MQTSLAPQLTAPPIGISRVLLVDDDRALASTVAAALREDGFFVTVAHDGRSGLKVFNAERFDVLLLDVLMPELDGLAVCQKVRAHSAVPIIFLTSRSDELDRIGGLELGADDYLAKPFSVRELAVRIRVIERRLQRAAAPEPTAAPLAVGELEVDLGRFEARWRGRPVVLTKSELLVLAALAQKPGIVLSRDRLIDLSKGTDTVITERTIDTFVKRIRAKLKAVDARFDAIETVIGVGYRLKRP